MTIYRLFHLTPGEHLDSGHPDQDMVFEASYYGTVEPAIRSGLYRETARVDTDDLSSVFPLTNNIAGSWTANSQVTAHAEALDGCRSTSIGDLVLDETDGSLHACVQVGWRRLGDEIRDHFLDQLGTTIPVIESEAGDLSP